MQGLLKPKGKLLKLYGYIPTVNTVYKVTESFIDLLEKIIPKKDIYFNGEYPQMVLEDSKRLIKSTYHVKDEKTNRF